MSSDIGIGGQVFADGRDLSRGLSAFRATFVQGNVDNTRLRTPARFRTHAVTLDGGSMGFTGDLPDDDADALVYAQDFLTRDDEPRTLFMAPFGADVGKLALIGKGIRTTMELGAEVEAILSLNAEFEITAASPGIMPGLTLFSPNLEGGTLTQNEQVDLVFTNTDPNQFFALKASGTSETFAFQAATSNSALKAGIEALAAYTGRTATITGSLTGTTLKSGSKRIEFDGAVDVPALELTQGVLHVLTLTGASGTKTIYGNVVVNVSSSTAQTVQDDVRAKGGQYGAVVVTKTGSGGTAVYTFAYPVGATPAALVVPTFTGNEVQTLYSASTASIALNALGGTSQTLLSSDSLGTIGNKIAATRSGITAGDVVATGQVVQGIGTAGTGLLIAGAGDSTYDGFYTPIANFAGQLAYQKGSGGSARYLFYHGGAQGYCLHTSLLNYPSDSASPDYIRQAGGTQIEGGWTANAGPGPAPQSAYDPNGGYVISGAADTTFNGSYIAAGWINGGTYYRKGTGSGARYLYRSSGLYSLAPAMDGQNTYYRNASDGVIGTWFTPGNGTTGVPNPAVAIADNSGNLFDLTVTFSGASAANTNQAQMTTPTGGVTITTTQNGGVGPDTETSASVVQGGDATTVTYSLVQQGGSFTGVNVISAVTSGGTVRDFTTTTVTTNGMLVTLQSLLAVVGTSTWKIQHAPDNAGTAGTFVDLLSFDVVNGTGAQTKEVPVGTTIYPYIRARCTAITGSAQVAVAAARRF